jgi:acyl CoA:acetate/3-ketoacid CoA transferase alpha subunit
MAIDTNAITTLVINDLTNILTIDPNSKYTNLKIGVQMNNGRLVTTIGSYVAPAGEFYTPTDIDTICKNILNQVTTTSGTVIIQKFEDSEAPQQLNRLYYYPIDPSHYINAVVAYVS